MQQSQNSALAKLVNEWSQAIFIRLRDRNYPALVKILMDLQNNIMDWTKSIEEQSNPQEVEKQIKRAKNEVDKCIKDLQKNYDQFYKFCYELRRTDDEKDFYTSTFLDERINNEMILNIIHSNFFKNKKM